MNPRPVDVVMGAFFFIPTRCHAVISFIFAHRGFSLANLAVALRSQHGPSELRCRSVCLSLCCRGLTSNLILGLLLLDGHLCHGGCNSTHLRHHRRRSGQHRVHRRFRECRTATLSSISRAVRWIVDRSLRISPPPSSSWWKRRAEGPYT